MLELLAVGTVSNATSAEHAKAVQLANNIREITLRLAFFDPQNPTQWTSRENSVAAYDNLTDFDGQTFSPPLSVSRTSMSGMDGWSQRVSVTPVADQNYGVSLPKTGSVRCARVTAEILHHNRLVYSCSWIAVAPNAD